MIILTIPYTIYLNIFSKLIQSFFAPISNRRPATDGGAAWDVYGENCGVCCVATGPA
jgi:hypothetical protein